MQSSCAFRDLCYTTLYALLGLVGILIAYRLYIQYTKMYFYSKQGIPMMTGNVPILGNLLRLG